MQETWSNLSRFGREELPGLIVPVVILIVGWLLAFLVAWLVRAGLDRTHLDERLGRRVLGEERAREMSISRGVSRGAYWLVLLFTILAVLQSLQLTAATEPFQELLSAIFGYIPRLIGAALIVLVAWVLAVAVRKGTFVLLRKWDVDRRLGGAGDTGTAAGEGGEGVREGGSVAKTLSETAYWLVFLLFVPAILGALQLEGLLSPVEGMLQEILAFLPNLASAALVFAVGWFVAKILMRLTTNVLAGLGLDRLSERVGLDRALGERPLSAFLGIVVQVLVLVPVIIAALQALQIESVTGPASDMLQTFFAALPLIFGAALIIGVAYVVGRLVRGLVRSLLDGVGFDRLPTRLGISERVLGERSASDGAGILAEIAIIYFAAMEAARMLELDTVGNLMADVAVLGGQILLGLAIFAVGLWLANLAASAVRRSDLRQADLLAIVSRVSILALAGAMALRQMGLANEIIELAFGLALGAVAVAAALAFGLGGRDAAGKTVESWRHRVRERDTGVHPTGHEAAE